MAERSKRCDGTVRRLRTYLLQNFEPVWHLVASVPFLARRANTYIINTACNAAAARPHPMSTRTDYTSWSSLTDRTFLGRSIPPAEPDPDLPSVEEVTKLFIPRDGRQRECSKSTLLFPVFAQYLTDGFLRTDMKDRRKTTSNHDIDLSPLYGRTPTQTSALRLKSDEPGRRGRLKSQNIEGEEFPPSLYDAGTGKLHADFVDDHGAHLLDPPLGLRDDWAFGEHSRRYLFAVGGDRANSTALVGMMNTLFLREHNRLAGELERLNPEWDDTRVFETARNIVIVLFIKIVVEEYINHISSACFRLRANPAVAWPAPWNRPNWMTVEFSLLYRWHSLIPKEMHWDGRLVDSATLLLDNSSLVQAGLANAFKWVSQTHAAKLDLHNTAIFLERDMTVESLAIRQNREQRLQGYNAYRKSMGMKVVDGFDCITEDEALRAELSTLYGHPDRVDFYVGLFAEDNGPNSPMPPLLGAMVALDAFSQALNNPLLSKQVYNARTFSEFGMEVIERTEALADIVARNPGAKSPADISAATVRMTRADWKRRHAAF
ncbi:peroxidase family protein [Roseitranquillus sediminis]|uniref:peroxidase family protein n=1 Tax=Roseitranquillus sediminis TaxID=2809051 RepID=UPI001D0C4C13|nr:peroxidase family protein [Roseitranquillus sediminis]